LEIARKKAHGFGFDQCEFVQADMAHMTLPPETFDLVMCSFALWSEPEHLFSESYRLLKPQGALLVQSWAWEKDAAREAYNGVAQKYLDTIQHESLTSIRALMAEHRAWWAPMAAPEDYAALLRKVGFAAVRAEWCKLPMHFADAQEFVEFLNLTVWRRRQVALLPAEKRAAFIAEAEQAVTPFETTKGIDVETRAIQVLARK